MLIQIRIKAGQEGQSRAEQNWDIAVLPNIGAKTSVLIALHELDEGLCAKEERK